MITLTFTEEEAIIMRTALGALAYSLEGKRAATDNSIQWCRDATALRQRVIEAQNAAFEAKLKRKISQ